MRTATRLVAVTLSVSDRLDLSALVNRYAATVDDRDIEAVVGLFTGDGELALPEPPDVADALAAALCHYHAVKLPAGEPGA